MTKENPEESSIFKVNDQRKFNPDGSPREEDDSGPLRPPVDQDNQDAAKIKEPISDDPPKDSRSEEASLPAEFATLILTLASSAQAALGVAPDPLNGKVQVNLNQAKHMIDLLGMLETKTKGNLTLEELGLLQAVLSDLRMRFIELKKGTGS